MNRAGYNGKLLPPWYEEALASLTEFRTHELNRVFCRTRLLSEGGTLGGRAEIDFDGSSVRDGDWRPLLAEALEGRGVLAFDKLAQLDFSSLELVDVATGMAILEWLASREPGALGRFHAALRSGQPHGGTRVIQDGPRRQRMYDAAFQAAAGMGFRQADQEWREWFPGP